MFFLRSVWLGISIGALASVGAGLVYIAILREPGAAFYPFAGLTFFGGPLLGGIVAASKTQEQKHTPSRRPFGKVFLASGSAVFGITCALFAVTYGVLPQFSRANIQLPEPCDGFDGTFNPPPHLSYTLPGGDTALSIISDAESAVVVQVAEDAPPFTSTVFLLDKKDNKILQAMSFDNDIVSAALDKGVAYIFNDKLGYLFDSHTGAFEETFLIMDNYGGLTETDRPIISRASSGHWYLETTAVISSWHIDGTVKSRPHLIFNGIARGCFISGETGEVVKY